VFSQSPIINLSGLAKKHCILGRLIFSPDTYALELLIV